VPVVHHAAQAEAARMTALAARRTRTLVAAVLVAVAIAFVVSAWPQRGSRPEVGIAPSVAGPLRLASCREWNRATGPQRLGTVRQLTVLSGGPITGLTNARGPQLDDQQAYDMLERSCAPEYARAFKLYKLYGRSAAFLGH
jgi:hypothetical protein